MALQVIRSIDWKVTYCESIIDYSFSDKFLCLEALNAAGVPVEYDGHRHHVSKNDAMAVLGDSCMTAVLCKRWWEKGSRVKGQWNTIRNDLLSNAPLTKVGRSFDVDNCIILNPGTLPDANGNMATDKMVATAVEAIMGAVYLDGGEIGLKGVMQYLGLTQHRLL